MDVLTDAGKLKLERQAHLQYRLDKIAEVKVLLQKLENEAWQYKKLIHKKGACRRMTPEDIKGKTKHDVNLWLTRAQEKVKESYKTFAEGTDGDISKFPHLTVKFGKKYAKIISDEASAWAFIDLRNGDVLKPASWKAPAKHARGNIYDINGGVGRLGWTGPHYLR